MKGKIYHLCYTSHGEVLCRKYLDYCMLFNCIAQATIGTDAQLLAYAIMSTHVHLIVITEHPAAYIQTSHSDNGASGGLYPENKIVLHSDV